LTLGAFVAAGVVKQTLVDFNVPFAFVYGRPGDIDVLSQIERVYRAAKAIKRLRNTRIGLIGYPALGMYTGTVDPMKVKKMLGPEIVHMDQYQLIQKSEAVSDSHAKKITENIEDLAGFRSGVGKENITLSSKMYAALKQLIRENQLDAVTVKCQYELSQIYKYTPCVALSILGDEFPSSCEGDLLTILSQVILHYLTGEAVTYTDIHEILDERVLVASCGFAPFSMSEREERAISRWGWEAFSGVLNSSPLRKGAVTLSRLSRDGEGFKMHVATGRSVGRSVWNEVGCPPFPGTDIVLDGNTGLFAKELVSNHYALVFRDVREELELLCRHLNIRYVYT
jgi:L-fucose isomerase-like protein